MDIAELIGDATDRYVVEGVWATVHLYDEEPVWANVIETVQAMFSNQGGRSVAEAEALVLEAAAEGEVTINLNDEMQWCVTLDAETEARTTRRYWYWELKRSGIEVLPLFHWPNEDTIARQAVSAWAADHGCAPTWDEMCVAIATHIGDIDGDVANQMAHNAVLSGAVRNCELTAPFRYVCGDFTPFDWDALL